MLDIRHLSHPRTVARPGYLAMIRNRGIDAPWLEETQNARRIEQNPWCPLIPSWQMERYTTEDYLRPRKEYPSSHIVTNCGALNESPWPQDDDSSFIDAMMADSQS